MTDGKGTVHGLFKLVFVDLSVPSRNQILQHIMRESLLQVTTRLLTQDEHLAHLIHWSNEHTLEPVAPQLPIAPRRSLPGGGMLDGVVDGFNNITGRSTSKQEGGGASGGGLAGAAGGLLLFEKPDPRIKLEAKWVPKFQQNHSF